VLEASALVQLCNIKVISKWIDIKDSEGVNFRVHTLAAFKDGEHDVNKPTLLLVHGAGSGALVWVPTFDNLVNDFNIYALDLPGFGRSMSPPSLYKCKTSVECQDWFVDFLELYCVSMKLEKIVYAGHSFGGCIGVSFCFRRSYLISKVILIDCGGFSPLPGIYVFYFIFIVSYNYVWLQVIKLHIWLCFSKQNFYRGCCSL
jgi:pimeloyl-ACP methyl ester carboxylesterase